PFPLTMMQYPGRREALFESMQQCTGQFALVRTKRSGGPLRPVHVVDRNKGRLPTHGESHVTRGEVSVNCVSKGGNGLPLCFSIGLGYTWIFMQACAAHTEVKLHFTRLHLSCHWGCAYGVWGAG